MIKLLKKIDLQKTEIRFILCGAYNTSFAYLLGTFLLYILPFSIFITTIIAYFLGCIHNYFSFKFFVFKTKNNFLKEVAKISLSYSWILAIQEILMYAFKNLPYFISYFIITFISACLSYFLHKFFTFKN